MPTLRAATAPKSTPASVAISSAAITATHGFQAASSPPSAATRLANIMPAMA